MEGSIVEEHRFLISDAAKMVAVEAHVLRYWEEELELSIGRTELGHRYYTRENIETFQKVKRLKEEGLQLKAIKLVIQRMNEQTAAKEPQEQRTTPENGAAREEAARQTEQSVVPVMVMEDNARKLEQFRELVEGIVGKVVRDNNDELQRRIEESVAKETEYLLHMQEAREEERFRRLDEAIRQHQKNNRYVAAAKERGGFWDKLFRH